MTAFEPGALALVRTALSQEPAGLLSDLDGTLAPIVTDPTAVALADGARDVLAGLAGRLAVVGVITGRAAADARRIAGIPELLVIGNHGLESLDPGSAQPRLAVELAPTEALLRSALAALPQEPGVAVDEKGLSATVHYRNAPRPALARRRILAALAHLPNGLELREGRLSVELRPAGAGDKGTALRQVVARYRLRGLAVAGDDMTDLDMFRAAAELRAAGRLEAAIVAVGGSGEVPGAVVEAADALVASPDELVRLLAAI
ncbi:MAG: trehalose-phosphatase [Chloroflexota bacterium]|nr:trehalose-phosphatase [Chloroflexota bacterium]MDQ2940780.1 trehalose-phosphatase [Chloroflexota bacterium]